MLSSGDPNVRFFGALTYTVKLNSDWQSLSPESLSQLLLQLLNWFLAHSHGPRFITQKLAATLLLVLIKFPELPNSIWPYPVHDVVISASRNTPTVGTREPLDDRVFQSAVQSLDAHDLSLVLLFCTTFAEEISRADVPRQDRPPLYKLLLNSTPHTLAVIKPTLLTAPSSIASPDSFHPVLISVLKSFRAWTIACVSADANAPVVSALAELLPSVIGFLQIESDKSVYATVIDVLIDFMEWADKLVTSESSKILLDLFSSSYAASKIEKVGSNSDDDEGDITGAFLNAFICFGELIAKDIAADLGRPEHRRILELMLELLRIPGFPIEDENVSNRTLEFWDLFVESILYDDDGTLLATDKDVRLSDAQNVMMQVIELLWTKLRLPDSNVAVRWTQDSRDGFFAFRKDVADLIESAYQLVGTRLYSVLVQFVITSVSVTPLDWVGIEASLYVLNGIMQSLTSDPPEFEFFQMLLDSKLFSILSSSPLLRARLTSLSLIASAIPYFQSDAGKKHIPTVVTYLFQCLASPSLALHASRSIFQLCSECATALSGDVPLFLNIYRDMLANGGAIDGIAKERIAGAIAEVLQQGVDDLELRTAYLRDLVDLLGGYAEEAVRLAGDPGAVPDARDIAASVLKSLGMVGKACRRVEDIDDTVTSAAELDHHWNGDGASGRLVKDKIIQIVSAISHMPVFAGDITIRQNATGVLKAGLSEVLPGPFTWPADVIFGYIRDEIVRVEKLDTLQPVLKLAESLVASYSNSQTPDIHDLCGQLLELLYIGALVPNNAITSSLDPDVNQGILDVLGKFLQRYLDVILACPYFESLILQFGVAMVTAKEPLVVKSAIKFWNDLLNLSPDSQSAAVAHATKQVIDIAGPPLLSAVAAAAGGACPRSLITEYAKIIKSFFRTNTGSAEKWLTTALQIESCPPDKAKARRVFVEKLARLRGRPPTETIVKDFWIAERGQTCDYV
ncbi:armadillo-type protein [Lipomyces kononenkoae]|uniref:Armadillo-type protein n=1 Tax=Lipomyces kononenkoae TaxID=34357 RepID=A0ACC3SY53_LIPKO